MPSTPALPKPSEDLLVDFFVNVYASVDDPDGSLEFMLDGDRRLAALWIEEWSGLAKSDPSRFLRCGSPEMGNVTLRTWLRERHRVVGGARPNDNLGGKAFGAK